MQTFLKCDVVRHCMQAGEFSRADSGIIPHTFSRSPELALFPTSAFAPHRIHPRPRRPPATYYTAKLRHRHRYRTVARQPANPPLRLACYVRKP